MAVLGLKSAGLLRIRHRHPAKLRLPLVKGSRADPVAAAQIPNSGPSLVLLQYLDDLYFLKSLLYSSAPYAMVSGLYKILG
jgi:hypothetical protein